MNSRQLHRIQEDYRALRQLATAGLEAAGRFDCRRTANGFIWVYQGIPGLALWAEGLTVWQCWQALVALGPRYPVEAPRVFITTVGHRARPFHPNILPVPPHLLCYGHHQPVQLLDGLARRLVRILRLDSGAIMTDERNSLHPEACQPVRRLVQEGAVPLRLGKPLPDWCRVRGCRTGKL